MIETRIRKDQRNLALVHITWFDAHLLIPMVSRPRPGLFTPLDIGEPISCQNVFLANDLAKLSFHQNSPQVPKKDNILNNTFCWDPVL